MVHNRDLIFVLNVKTKITYSEDMDCLPDVIQKVLCLISEKAETRS